MQDKPLNRRQFLLSAAAFSIFSPTKLWVPAPPAKVQTVQGVIRSVDMGITLPHEHILVDFIGAESVSPDRYDAEEVFRVALPHLQQLYKLGCRTLVECTPAYLGRDAALLQRLSKASGLQILTNTGYYSAVGGKYLPSHAFSETATQLSARWVREWAAGIDGTGIKPGFIKISVDKAPLKEYSQKIVKAAALTHLQTGLTIAAHTGNGAAALEEIEILRSNGVKESAFIWVHAQNEKDAKVHQEMARRGAWVEFDGLNAENIEDYLQYVQSMRKAGLLQNTLLSHDAGWYHAGETGGGSYRPYDTLFKRLLPSLRRIGFTGAQIDQLLVVNPRNAFTLRIRKT